MRSTVSRARFVAGLVLYVVISSILGLVTGGLTGPEIGDRNPVSLLSSFWGASPSADAVFVLGSAAVGGLAYIVALRRRWLASLGLGLAGTWIVYVTSFWTLVETPGTRFEPFASEPFFGLLDAITAVGFLGILFGGLAPAYAAWKVQQGRGEPDDAPTSEGGGQARPPGG